MAPTIASWPNHQIIKITLCGPTRRGGGASRPSMSPDCCQPGDYPILSHLIESVASWTFQVAAIGNFGYTTASSYTRWIASKFPPVDAPFASSRFQPRHIPNKRESVQLPKCTSLVAYSRLMPLRLKRLIASKYAPRRPRRVNSRFRPPPPTLAHLV